MPSAEDRRANKERRLRAQARSLSLQEEEALAYVIFSAGFLDTMRSTLGCGSDAFLRGCFGERFAFQFVFMLFDCEGEANVHYCA